MKDKVELPLISVIILNYNGREVLKDCIDSVLRSSYPELEVIVVDNGSTDESYKIAEKYGQKVKLIRSSYNLGYSAGNNLGIKVARGDYILLLNNDAILHPECISELVKVALTDPKIGVLGCKVYYRGTRIIQHAGGRLNLTATTLPHIGAFEKDRGQYDEVKDVDYVSGVAMMISRKAVNKIGFLDEEYFAYWEDVDYCFKARKADFRIVYVPKAVVEHYESFSWKKKSFLQKYLFQRNRLLFILKNFSGKQLIYILLKEPKRVIQMVYEGIKRLLPDAPQKIFGESVHNIDQKLVKKRLEFSIFGMFQWALALVASYLWLICFGLFHYSKHRMPKEGPIK